MNYTTWIKENIPSLESLSIAETDDLIKKTQKSCFLIFFLLRIIFLVIILLLLSAIAKPFDVQILQGIAGWILWITGCLSSEFLFRPIEVYLVKRNLRKIANAV